MNNTHPYISGPNNITQIITHLRKNFPQTIDANTIKKLGIAPKNESYVINALHFVNLIDENGNKTSEAKTVFSLHKDEDFRKEFSELVQQSYSELFELHGEDAWALDKDSLIAFFRQSDETSAAIGARQASTFKVFASMSGFGDLPTSRSKTSSTKPKTHTKNKTKIPQKQSTTTNEQISLGQQENNKGLSLSVRVEINLPSDASKETYDNIFCSIRENLLNGK